MALKFEDCAGCLNRRKKWICGDCDMGELFEDEESGGVDTVFREAPTRFGESVTTDEPEPEFSPDRFADTYEDETNDDD